VNTYTFRVSYPRPMTPAESEAIAAAMVATARRLAEAAPPAVSAAPPEPTEDTPPIVAAAFLEDDAPPPPSVARVHLIGTLIAVVLLALLWLWFSAPALTTLPALWGGR
jgi:hypothetical protein